MHVHIIFTQESFFSYFYCFWGGGGEKGNKKFFCNSYSHNKKLCILKPKHAIYFKLTSYKEKEIEIVNDEYIKQLFFMNLLLIVNI